MASYKITGKRFLRKYTAETLTPTYAAEADAVKIAERLCEVQWMPTARDIVSTFPAHSGNEKTDGDNITNRDWFDAALFCGEHANGMHRAFANGACYRFTLPDAAVGISLTELKARIFSDPYNAYGARVALFTSSSPDVPMACATCRKGSSADESTSAQSNNGTESTPATEWYSTNTHVEGVAPRRSDGTSWFTNSGAAFIRPTGGIILQKYLFVFVLMERYDVARNGYLEGSSYSDPKFDITTAAAIPVWSEGDVYDLSAGRLWEIRNYTGNKDVYSVVGTIEGKKSVLFSKCCYGIDVGLVYGSESETDCGFIRGLTLVCGRDSLGKVGAVMKDQSAGFLDVDLSNAKEISAGCQLISSAVSGYRLDIVWIDQKNVVRRVKNIIIEKPSTEGASDPVIDASNAEVVSEFVVDDDFDMIDFRPMWTYNGDGEDRNIMAMYRLVSGGLVYLLRNYSEDSIIKRYIDVSGGRVSKIMHADYLTAAFIIAGSFEGIGGVEVPGFAKVSMNTGSYQITVNPINGFAKVDEPDKIKSFFVRSIDESQIGSAYYGTVYGDFKSVNGKPVNGAFAVNKDGAVFSLVGADFVITPSGVTNGDNYARATGLAIVR